ncbi:hypothetical protein [Escherichia coli]|uniref:hypothetical protein n=1 Tax=Escherichia coli TaxID=562 RepID=UPI0010D63363|nr:hypothetical protein [Escherichia coli]GDM19288.1 hypothetical protein BvCmsNSNP012_04341 [Escherichia coli]
MLKKTLLISLAISCTGVVADDDSGRSYYQNFFWEPVSDQPVISNVSPVTISDDSAHAKGTVEFPGNGRYRVIKSQCGPESSKLSRPWGDNTYWIQYPDGIQRDKSSGLVYTIDVNWNDPTSNSAINKYATRATNTQRFPYQGDDNDCWSVGQETDVIMSANVVRKAEITVDIQRGNAWPGTYSLEVPFKWMFEERKWSQGYNMPAPIYPEAASDLNQNGIEGTLVIPLTIQSKCRFNTKTITLNHQTLQGRDAHGNKVNSPLIDVECTPGAKLKLKLKGMQPSSEGKNYTDCLIGKCKLTFTENKDQTEKVDGVINYTHNQGYDKKSFYISSTFYLNNPDEPTGGEIKGSGILEMLVE